MINVMTVAASWGPLIFGIAMGVLSIHVAGCAAMAEAGGEEKKMAAKTIQEVLEEHTDEWMSIPGVVGTAIGEVEGKPCIRILAAKKTEELTKQIPRDVEGFLVVISETGEIRALGSD